MQTEWQAEELNENTPPFTQTLDFHPPLSFLIHSALSDAALLPHSLLSESSCSFFFPQKTCREERRRRKDGTRRCRQEREEAEKVGRGARRRQERRERRERGRPDGRKEGRDLSAGSSARLKDPAEINKSMNQSL